jgi:alpha-L-rhamnosidase
MTQHGFRYVELTFPGAENQPPPSLETLTAINVRSSVDLAGDLTFSDEMLQSVHHNYLWGQASNLMMVPSVRKTAFFVEFSLCLSRACLGKMIVFV